MVRYGFIIFLWISATLAHAGMGDAWTTVTSQAPLATACPSVYYHGKIWVYESHSVLNIPSQNAVWSSANGKNWECVTTSTAWSPRNGHAAVVFDDKMWILGGSVALDRHTTGTSDVWYSSNGRDWTSATIRAAWPGRSGHLALSYNNRIWVLSGWDQRRYYGPIPLFTDVWSSPDGEHWTSHTLKTPWDMAREGLAATVFKDRMWVIGGHMSYFCETWLPSQFPHEVWSSADGTSWTLETDSAAWPGRQGHTLAASAGKMWLIGGSGYGGISQYKALTDVWCTADGVKWQQMTNQVPWKGKPGRCLSTGNDLWFLSGNCVYRAEPHLQTNGEWLINSH